MRRRGNKFTLIVAGALVLSSITGCGKKEEATTTAATTKAEVTTEAQTQTDAEKEDVTTEAENSGVPSDDFDYASKEAEDLVAMIKDPANPTLEEFVWLCSTLQYVKINDDLTLESCNTWKAISLVNDAIRENDGKRPDTKDIYNALIQSESPQVRGYALSYVGGLFGTTDDEIAECKRIMESEQDLYVIKCLLDALSNELATDPAIAEYFLKMSEHENPAIRLQATFGLANSWSKGVDGVLDAVIRLMNDEDEDVAKYACKGSGELRDESVIEPLVAILNNPELANIHGGAVDGLVTMWFDYPFHEGTSEAAYNATMDYWKKTPRTEDVPAWTSVTLIKNINDSKYDAWKANATYFNVDDVVAVMYDILMDSDANWLARSSAMDTIFVYATPDYCRGMQAAIDGLTDNDANNIKNSYQKHIEKLDEAQ